MNILAKDNNITLQKHTNDSLKVFDNLALKVNDNNLKEYIKYAILLHDIGKVLPYFQIRYVKNNNYKPFEITVNIYHSLLSVLFINQEKLKEKIGEENVNFVLSAIAYHHWKENLEFLIRYGSSNFEEFNDKLRDEIHNLKENILSELDAQKEIKDLIEFNNDMLNGLINGISFSDYIIPPYNLYWLPKRVEIDFEKKKKWILISGFLQRCDHFASFCEENKEQNCNVEIEPTNSEYVKSSIINLIKEKNQNFIEKNFWQYSKLKDTQKFAENLILVAPTGIGKTEFAFLWTNEKKLFYTLPIRAAVEQTYDRAMKIFKEDKVGLLHSDADIYLIKDNNELEKLKTYEISKQLAYPIIISTGDQFFPYGLKPPGYEKIYATFSYSNLVIDEVQAYNPKASAIIVKFIEDISKLGGKFLLMTATLPKYIEDEIYKRLFNNKLEKINLFEEEKDKYKKLIKHKIELIEVENKNNDFSLNNKDIIEKIVKDAKEKNKRVLVIFNTIKQAKYVYQKIKEKNQINEDNIILFHSQMTLNQREKIKYNIEENFKNPKDKDEKVGKILISTQVIEVSIDIDADVLYTEIAPMDVLVQRMGRVLRRYKDNYSLSDKDEPNIYIIKFTNGYESGRGKVYDKELIEKTDEILEKQFFKIKDKKEEKKKSKKNVKNVNDDEKSSIGFSEYNKYELINELYASLNFEAKFLSEFYTTLDILDAGFMSERKAEAQKIFREITNVPVVDKCNKKDFLEKVEKFCKDKTPNEFHYTLFKKEIIAEFVINIPYYQFSNIKNFKIENWIYETNIDDDKRKKILRWLDDVWVVNLENKISDNYNWGSII